MPELTAHLAVAQAATSANSLYHAWGLAAALIGICVLFLGVAWTMHKSKLEDVTLAVVKTRAVLFGLFQKTVDGEAFRILALIEDHLPIALSQADASGARPSAFDRLCAKLRELDLDAPDRESYKTLLENTLSGLMIGEARRLLQVADKEGSGRTGAHENPTGLKVGFEGQTEQALTLMAEKTAEMNKRERRLYRSKRSCQNFFSAAGVAGMLFVPTVFFDKFWALAGGATLLVCFALLATAGLVAWAAFGSYRDLLLETANRHQAPEDWIAEIPQQRTR